MGEASCMRNFKKALCSVLAVLLCFCLLTAAIVFPYYAWGTYPYQDARARGDLAGQFDLLVSSASQGLRAIDPRALDDALGCTSYDLGAPLQTMYGRYLFLKEELDRNPVEMVIVELSYDALTRSYSSGYGLEGSIYQLGRSDRLDLWLGYFFKQVPPADWAQLLYDTMDRGFRTWRQLLAGELVPPKHYETHGFWPGLESTPMPGPESYQKDYRTEALATEPQEDNLYWLDQCFALCQGRDVQVVVIATPLSEYMLWSTSGFDEILATHQAICEKWGVPFYDFNLKKDKLERYPEGTAYFDQHHLCEASARDFPYDLAEVLASEDPGALFYGSYEQAIHARFKALP